MKIKIQTHVNQHYLEVKSGFNESLFKKLSPPFPPVRLIRFDGSSKGDLVTLELDFFVFKQKWTSKIVEDVTNDHEFYFIDQGIDLPFFLKSWQHKHCIMQSGNGSIISDEISYEGPTGVFTYLLYPALYLQFWMRKPIYRKIFKK